MVFYYWSWISCVLSAGRIMRKLLHTGNSLKVCSLSIAFINSVAFVCGTIICRLNSVLLRVLWYNCLSVVLNSSCVVFLKRKCHDICIAWLMWNRTPSPQMWSVLIAKWDHAALPAINAFYTSAIFVLSHPLFISCYTFNQPERFETCVKLVGSPMGVERPTSSITRISEYGY